MAHDIPELGAQLHRLGRSIEHLAEGNQAEALISVICRPGWATLAEAILVRSMVDHLQAQVDDLASAYDTLVTTVQQLETSRSSRRPALRLVWRAPAGVEARRVRAGAPPG